MGLLLDTLDLDEQRALFQRASDAGGIAPWVDANVEGDAESVAALLDRLRAIEAQLRASPRALLMQSLSLACETPAVAWEHQDVDEPEELPPPRWSTGCANIDKVSGGGYGLTVFGGAPKTGKSMLAISSAIEAARAGWRVVYANCEMDRGDITRRIRNYMRVLDDTVVDRMHILHGNQGLSIENLLSEIDELVQCADDKVLVILDSINRAVDFQCAKTEQHYWGALSAWSHFAMQSRRLSGGKVSWLVVSELNRDLRVKGRSLEHLADLVVLLTAKQEPDVVSIEVAASRSTPSGDLGTHHRDFSNGRFHRE